MARPDVRVHVRRKVVQIPVRQAALRAIAAVAAKQGKGRSSNPLIISSLFWVVGKITLQILPRFFCVVSTLSPFSSIVEMLKTGDLGGGKRPTPRFGGGK